MSQAATEDVHGLIDPFQRAHVSAAPSFRSRLRAAVEAGVLLAVKWIVVLALWAGSGFYLWREVEVLRLQALRGQQAFQYLVQNEQKLNAALNPVPAPSASPDAKKASK